MFLEHIPFFCRPFSSSISKSYLVYVDPSLDEVPSEAYVGELNVSDILSPPNSFSQHNVKPPFIYQFS